MPILWGKLAAGLVFCAFAAVAQQKAADWPQTRGPANDGHVDAGNLALPWPNGKPTLLWKATLGDGYSGVIAVDGRLYTQAQTRSAWFTMRPVNGSSFPAGLDFSAGLRWPCWWLIR
jgi:hypothetical protein